MAHNITLTATLNRPQYPTLPTEQLAYIYIEAQPADALLPSSAPLNLAFVLDRSGSMGGQPIRDLKQAVKIIIEQLSPHDLVSVVIFDDTADIVLSSQPAADKDNLLNKIERIDERGGTRMSTGIEAGLAQLQQGMENGRVSRMILLTDGETWEDSDYCLQLAQQAGQMGIPITALGLGDDWNLALLTNLASASGGSCDYIDAPEKIAATFQTVVTAMQDTVVANAHLIIRLVAGVRPRAVWRVTPLIERLDHHVLSEQDVQVGLGELQQKGQAVLAELTFPPCPAGLHRMAQVELRYDIPSVNQQEEKVQQDLMIQFVANSAEAQAVNGRIMNIIEKVTAFKLQTQALDEAALGNLDGATRKLSAAATRLLSLGEAEMAQEAQQAAEQMATGQPLSSKATKKLHAVTRKLDMSDLIP